MRWRLVIGKMRDFKDRSGDWGKPVIAGEQSEK